MLNNKQYGPSSYTLSGIYKSLIRSRLEYGSTVFLSASASLLNKLEPVQNTCPRLILRAFPTSPISSLQAITGIPPLSLRRSFLAINYAIRSISKRNMTTLPQAHNRLLKLSIGTNANNIPITPTESITPLALCRKLIRLLPPPYPKWNHHPNRVIWDLKSRSNPTTTLPEQFDAILNRFSTWTCCFVDGSRTTTTAGAAYLIDSKITSLKLLPVTSANSAELIAIYQCLIHLPTSHSTKFLICSDSESPLSKIEREDPNCDLTSHTLSTIFSLHTNGIQTTFIWTPAHSAIPGNEIVDRAAKAAFINGTTLNVLVADDLRKHILSLLSDYWQQSWNSQPSKLRLFKKDITDWSRYISELCESNRHLETQTNRILLGHTQLTHKFIYEGTLLPQCPTCPDRSLTTVHCLTECSAYPRFNITDFNQNSLALLVDYLSTYKLSIM